MDRILSIEELRHWCNRHVKSGPVKHFDKDREMPTLGFLRSIGWRDIHFYEWLRGENRRMPAHIQRAMSRFVIAWEAGMLEFGREGAKRVLIRRDEPKRMPVRLRVSVGSERPLTFTSPYPKYEPPPKFRLTTFPKPL